MRPIPIKLRQRLANRTDMNTCCACKAGGKMEWNHVWIYAGKQINEIWSIVPLCTYCHRGNNGTIFQASKEASEKESIKRLVESNFENLELYYKKDWDSIIKQYGNSTRR
jgi:protein involved in ribonucleotide reduction